MTSSCYRSVRHVVGTTLLLFGLSLSVSPVLLAEEAFTKEAQRLEESATAATAATEDVTIAPPPPASGGSGWDFDSDRLLDFTATTLGATGGVVGGFYIWAVECGFASGPICGDGFLFTVMALAGVSGGYLAYKNRPLALVFGGLALGSSIGLAWDGFQSDQTLPPNSS